jgi:hypothetical protein
MRWFLGTTDGLAVRLKWQVAGEQKMIAHRLAGLLLLFGLTSPMSAIAQATDDADGTQPKIELLRDFEQKMNDARFVGSYTDLAGELQEEEYQIKEAKKLEAGDLWLFTARIRYGETDMTVPIPLAVKWAGETPVITLDDVTLPGLGTFSAHVVVDGDRYAGTWQHDEQGGHLFGSINPSDDD